MDKSAPKQGKRAWAFKTNFQDACYPWNGSAAAAKSVRAAVSEIRKHYRKEPLEAVDAAVYLMGRFWPAFRGVDDSRGVLGNAIDEAVDRLIPLTVEAPVDDEVRQKWTTRMFHAIRNEGVEHLRELASRWGVVCVTDSLRAYWISELLPDTQRALRSTVDDHFFFAGTPACLSCFLEAGRYAELRQTLDLDNKPFWPWESYWAEAVARQGDVDAAIKHARLMLNDEDDAFENDFSTYDPQRLDINRFCERTLYESGRRQEAYEQYALLPQGDIAYLNHFRRLVKRYPEHEPDKILMDLIENSGLPKQSWFSSACKCEMYDIALECALAGRITPRTIATAARNTLQSHPEFAWQISLLSIRNMLLEYKRVEPDNVALAVQHLVQAASNVRMLPTAIASLRKVLAMRKKAQKVPALVRAELRRLGVKSRM